MDTNNIIVFFFFKKIFTYIVTYKWIGYRLNCVHIYINLVLQFTFRNVGIFNIKTKNKSYITMKFQA